MNNQAILQAYHLLPEAENQKSTPSQFEQTQSSGQKHPYHVGKVKIEDGEYKSEVPEHLQNQEIPGFPSTVAVIGTPGSGKTNLCMNLLMNPMFWNKFFDTIYLLGPTVKMDKQFKNINVPDHQIVTKEEEFIPKLMEWTQKQEDAVKSDPKTAPKVLFFFEDMTAYRQTVQKDPEFSKAFTTIRHHKASAIVNFHKYTALERTARLNCMHICVFPVCRTDMEQIFKEYGTANLDMEDFMLMCRYCWKGDEVNKKPFLYINMYQPIEKRFRKCFTDIIDTSKFEGLGKVVKAKRKMKFEQIMGLHGGKNAKRFSPMDKRNRKRKRETDQQHIGDDESLEAWMQSNPILASLDTSLTKKMGDVTKEPSKDEMSQKKNEGWEKGAGRGSSSVFGKTPHTYRRSVYGNVFAYLR
jgi:hypothetical protein